MSEGERERERQRERERERQRQRQRQRQIDRESVFFLLYKQKVYIYSSDVQIIKMTKYDQIRH